MRVLIDECVNPRVAVRLRVDQPDWIVDTVREAGWAGRTDAFLVGEMQGRYDVFLTRDKGFEFEHNLERLSFGIVIVESRNNQMPAYDSIWRELVGVIEASQPKLVSRVPSL